MPGWNLPDQHTIGQFIEAVFAVKSEQEAKEFFEGGVDWVQRQIDAGTWKSNCDAVEAMRSDIGWCFGEGMDSSRIAMWRKVTGAAHPVFGDMSGVTPEKAFEAGKRLASSGSRLGQRRNLCEQRMQ